MTALSMGVAAVAPEEGAAVAAAVPRPRYPGPAVAVGPALSVPRAVVNITSPGLPAAVVVAVPVCPK